ncbi:MAG: baseplate J/gp47 family protein [Clostridia bacterium]|nr:baseplate J/gp47 family protein [Clostridia bacterium]
MFENNTRDAILADMLALVPDSMDKREGSIIYDALAPCAAELAGLYADLDTVIAETFVDTASLAGLILRAKERGIEYREAEQAQVLAEITASGEIAQGDRFILADGGLAYRWGGSTADGGGQYLLISEGTGTEYNVSSGSLIYDSTSALVSEAHIVGLAIPGRDAETADELRARYYNDIEASAFSGNVADYRERCLLIAGVGGVQVRRAPGGNAGTVGLVLVSDTYGVPTEAAVKAVQDYFDPIVNGSRTYEGMAPIGAEVTASAATGTGIAVATAGTEFESGVSAADVQSAAEDAVKDYLADCVAEWADNGVCYVRVGRIYTILSSIDGVTEPGTVSINGGAQSVLTFNGDAIPVFGSLTITEASS